MEETCNCHNCGKFLVIHDKDRVPIDEVYEYRGVYSCSDCFEEVESKRNRERAEVIAEQSAITDSYSHVDVFSDTPIAKENRKIFSAPLSAARKESKRLRDYEGREDKTNDK